ncbi:MAG: AraC family ligand binding domain-containing protein [Clostridia bacterium]|nr:AraC family ligand binding domain-containing protein [Clostridia bacterium]
MITQEILEKLMPISDEENLILAGASVNKSIYTNGDGNVIRHDKLISGDKLIHVRPHVRFAHFPQHTHDYIEVVYMCSGQTTHIINGNKLILKEGELLFLGQNAVLILIKGQTKNLN